MALTKAFIQLTPDSGDAFIPAVKLLSKTDFTSWVVDGSFTTSMSAPSMSGEDFQQMKDLAFTQEFKDKSTPIFFFSQSKSFCVNLVPAYMAACFSSPSTAIGLFQPTVVELHKTKGSSVIGEGTYEGNPVYMSLPSMTRGSQSVSTHIKNGSVCIARCIDYGYDLDSKSATKTVAIPASGWRFGANGGTQQTSLEMTNEYVFKFSTSGRSGRELIQTISYDSLTADDAETAVVYITKSAPVCGSIVRGACGYALTFTSDSGVLFSPSLSSKLNIPNSVFGGIANSCFFVSKVLTPQVIAAENASYLCNTINPYGVGEIFTVDKATSTVKSAGSSYTAIGSCSAVQSGSVLPNARYTLGIRVVANKESLSGKISIIKNGYGDGATFSTESSSYKVATANSYYVLKSGSDNPQEDQSYLYCFNEAAQKLMHLGYLQCVTDKNNQALSDSYTTGVMVVGNQMPSQGTTVSGKIYVLYDDNSIAISSYDVVVSGSRSGASSACPMKISADGKNIVAHRPYITKSYTGTTTFAKASAIGGLPADDAFIVPDNSSNSRKIEAVGIVYEPDRLGSNTYYPVSDIVNGTYLILEPKT